MVNTFEPALNSIPATPALVLDLSTLTHNAHRLADYAHAHGLQVRPHTKTHKSLEMARLQLDCGAIGLTVAKVGEAEVMAAASPDLLVAYPAVDPQRTQRLAQLAGSATVRVAVDSLAGIEALANAARAAGTTIGLLVDIDVGYHRTGVQSPAAALELAQRISNLGPALRLDGLFFYPGQIWSAAAQQDVELSRVEVLLAETIDQWHAAGLSVEIVSGGSTPTAFQSHLVPSQTEIRPGTYLFNDMNTVRAGFSFIEECAAAMLCTVVSTAVPGKAVIDAGTKTLTSDRNARFPDSGYGCVLEFPEASLMRLSEEHGEIDISQSAHPPRIGDRVTIVPNHICPCINLQDRVWLQLPDGSLEQMEIDTRGRLI